MKLYDRVLTPCIGVCSTGIGDSVCRGCKRFDFEVIQWNAYSEVQKASIEARLSELLSKVVKSRFKIFDATLLSRQIKLQQVTVSTLRDDYCHLFELLRAGASQIDDSQAYGFYSLAGHQDKTLAALKLEIDGEFYALSIAYFERYVLANRSRASCVSE